MSRSWHRLAGVSLLLPWLVACSSPSPPATMPEATIEALSRQVEALSAQVGSLQPERIATLEPAALPPLVSQNLPPDVETPSTSSALVSASVEPGPQDDDVRAEQQGVEVAVVEQPPLPTMTPEPTPAPPPTPFPTRTVRPTSVADSAPCRVGQVKGNKSSRIYHVPGGASYPRTVNNVECFDTEDQASAAGYRKARN